ncbi:MAG: DUF4097 domain-containing protein [Spirochaetes bacterium]|nr:DUF4097 domain-containing protein [Spirochaetota bacterium]
MKKEIKYLLIIGLIFIFILILCSYLLTIKRKNVDKDFKSANFKFNNYINNITEELIEKKLKYKYFEEKFSEFNNLEELKNIDIELININLKFKKSDTSTIRVETRLTYHSKSEEDLKKYIDEYNKDIKIEKDSFVINFSPKNKFYGPDIFKNINIIITGDITVFVPLNLKLEKFIIDIVSGDIDFKEVNIMTKCEIKGISGNISIEKSEFDKLNVNLVSGDFEIENSNMNYLFVNSVSGNFYADLLVSNIQKFQIKTISGNIELDVNNNFDQIYLETVSGDIKLNIKGSSFNDFYLKANTLSGEININDKNYSQKKGEIILNENIKDKKVIINSISGDININSFN